MTEIWVNFITWQCFSGYEKFYCLKTSFGPSLNLGLILFLSWCLDLDKFKRTWQISLLSKHFKLIKRHGIEIFVSPNLNKRANLDPVKIYAQITSPSSLYTCICFLCRPRCRSGQPTWACTMSTTRKCWASCLSCWMLSGRAHTHAVGVKRSLPVHSAGCLLSGSVSPPRYGTVTRLLICDICLLRLANINNINETIRAFVSAMAQNKDQMPQWNTVYYFIMIYIAECVKLGVA